MKKIIALLLPVALLLSFGCNRGGDPNAGEVSIIPTRPFVTPMPENSQSMLNSPENISFTSTKLVFPEDADESDADYILDYSFPVFGSSYKACDNINATLEMYRDELIQRVSLERVPLADAAEGEMTPYTRVVCDVSISSGCINAVFFEEYAYVAERTGHIVTSVVMDMGGNERSLGYVLGEYMPDALVAQQVLNAISLSPDEYYEDLDLDGVAWSLDLYNGFSVLPYGIRLYMPEGSVAAPEKGVMTFDVEWRDLAPYFVGDVVSTDTFKLIKTAANDLAAACAASFSGFEGGMPDSYIATEFMISTLLRMEYGRAAGSLEVSESRFNELFEGYFGCAFPGLYPTADEGRIRFENGSCKITAPVELNRYGVDLDGAELADDGTLVFTGALMYGFPGDADSSFAAGIKITLTPNEDAPMGYVFTAVSVF